MHFQKLLPKLTALSLAILPACSIDELVTIKRTDPNGNTHEMTITKENYEKLKKQGGIPDSWSIEQQKK